MYNYANSGQWKPFLITDIFLAELFLRRSYLAAIPYFVDPEKPTTLQRAVYFHWALADFGGVMPLLGGDFVGDHCPIGCWRAVTAIESAQKQASVAASYAG